MKDSLDFEWPNKGDRLLSAKGAGPSGPTFSNRERERHSQLWDGYMTAGAVLIDHCDQNPFDSHDVIFPALFCYRHGLELAMKWIISRYGKCAGIKSTEIAHHDLWQLWLATRNIILKVGSDGENDALDAVGQMVKDFHELDQGSFAFRYATEKNGAVIHLPSGKIDLAHFKGRIEAVNNLFEGADAQMDDNISAAPF